MGAATAPLQRNVGWQRHRADGADRVVEHVTREIERELDLAGFAFRRYGRIERTHHTAVARVAEVDTVARLQAFCRTCEGAPGVIADALGQVEINFRLRLAADADAGKRRRDHAGIIEDECIARLQQAWKIAHDFVREIGVVTDAAALDRAHDQQARRIARLNGVKCDGAFRQFEFEKIGSHCAGLPLSPS